MHPEKSLVRRRFLSAALRRDKARSPHKNALLSDGLTRNYSHCTSTASERSRRNFSLFFGELSFSREKENPQTL